jgi:thioredoxin reductase
MAYEADINVLIVGAGPYGLSIAAHLREKGVDFRIFGQPMNTWQTAMPKGMFLKSEGFASSLYDPRGEFTLARYCADHGQEYSDIGTPVPLATFVAYGLEFQQRFVPDLDQRSVSRIVEGGGGFVVTLEDGVEIAAKSVILAIGISAYPYVPSNLSALPSHLVSHSADHLEFDEFVDRDVALIGGGSSAIDIAALLHEVGARPVIVARSQALEYLSPPADHRPLLTRIRRPLSCIGQDWRRRIFTDVPSLFHAMPKPIRLREVKMKLGPSGAWYMQDIVKRLIPTRLGRQMGDISISGDRVSLTLVGPEGPAEVLEVDHIIAATGFRVDVNRVTILDAAIRAKLATMDGAPSLSANFESSVPGLFFVGVSAMNSMGPVFRFACGAEYTATRLARFLARNVPAPSPAKVTA